MGEVFEIAKKVSKLALKLSKQATKLMEESEWPDVMLAFDRAIDRNSNMREIAVLDEAFATTSKSNGHLRLADSSTIASAVEAMSFSVYSQTAVKHVAERVFSRSTWYQALSDEAAIEKQAAYILSKLEEARPQIELLDAISGRGSSSEQHLLSEKLPD